MGTVELDMVVVGVGVVGEAVFNVVDAKVAVDVVDEVVVDVVVVIIEMEKLTDF